MIGFRHSTLSCEENNKFLEELQALLPSVVVVDIGAERPPRLSANDFDDAPLLVTTVKRGWEGDGASQVSSVITAYLSGAVEAAPHEFAVVSQENLSDAVVLADHAVQQSRSVLPVSYCDVHAFSE